LGEALGQLYVAKTFTPQAKERARSMVANLVAALKDDLTTLSWMSDETRQKAIAKLEAYVRKIGYPDKWRDYEALRVNRGAYYNNAIAAGEFDFRRNLGKIGKPVDRTEWGMSPPTVNAYYNPQFNEIVFPAGILQPPFYDPKADDAFNYGGMGAVIGHEMTHGFDDQGARFDANGNLVMWWTPDDYKKFTDRTNCVVKQFDSFEVEPGPFPERAARGRRISCGSRRAHGRLCRLSEIYRGQATSEGHQRLHARAALLSWLGTDLGAEHSARSRPPAKCD
jgi:putative endopeptidase